MSKNREKVFEDPLSMFGGPAAAPSNVVEEDEPAPAPVKKVVAEPVAAKQPVKETPAPVVASKPVIKEEPLPVPVVKKTSILDEPTKPSKSSLFGDETAKASKASVFDDDTSLPAPPVASASTTKSDPLFREIDASKVTFKKEKKKTVVEDNTTKLSAAEKGLGFATDLWSNDVLSSTTSKPKADLDDIFGGSTDKSKSYALGDDALFSGYDPSKQVAKKDEDVSKLRTGTTTEVKSINIRGAKNDDEENALTDLSVAKLLEREEELDYDMFGKVKLDNNKHITKTIKKNKDVFDLESEDYLNELEAVTNKKDTTSSTTTKKVAPKATVSAAKEIDMSSLDLDAYISQQQASSGGGLFD